MRRVSFPSLGGWVPVVAGGLAMALLVVLAWQAVDASRSHRAAAEAVVEDYLSYAGERLTDTVRTAVAEQLQTLACTGAAGRRSIAKAMASSTEDADRCQTLRPAAVFVNMPDAGEIEILAGALSSADANELVRWLTESPCPGRPYCIGVLPGETPFVVLAQSAADLRGRRVVGVILPGTEFGRFVDALADPAVLLPRALARKGERLGAGWLRVSAIRSGDAALYEASGSEAPVLTAAVPLGGEGEDLSASLGLRADAVAALVIGGLPSSRLPIILTLLGVCLALGGAAVWQVRREQRLARRRSELIAHVSHEIRTPVAQIRLFAETLRYGRVRSRDEAARSLDIIDEEAGRLAGLVDNLLQFTRSGDTRRPLAPVSVPVGAFLASVADRFAPLAMLKDVEVRLAVGDDVTDAWVDPAALGQVVFNLLDNALKYGPAGQPIELGASTAGPSVRLWVRDRGPGIPDRDAARVWEPFARLSREVEQRVQGTGVGLAIVRDLVSRQGGLAWIEHPSGGGARVVVELPAAGAVRRATA